MSGRGDLARALFDWNTPTDPYFVITGRSGDTDDRDPYVPIIDAILADPGPLLAALADAGVLQEETTVPVLAGFYRLPGARTRYVTEWQADA